MQTDTPFSPLTPADTPGLPAASASQPARASQPEEVRPQISNPAQPPESADTSPTLADANPAAQDPSADEDAGAEPAALALAARQIVEHPHLPSSVRQALAELVARRGQLHQGNVQLPVTDLVPVLVQALPVFLRRDAEQLGVAEHPAGDVFFEGLAGELSEAQAERLARAQLAASGLLRGQSARNVV